MFMRTRLFLRNAVMLFSAVLMLFACKEEQQDERALLDGVPGDARVVGRFSPASLIPKVEAYADSADRTVLRQLASGEAGISPEEMVLFLDVKGGLWLVGCVEDESKLAASGLFVFENEDDVVKTYRSASGENTLYVLSDGNLCWLTGNRDREDACKAVTGRYALLDSATSARAVPGLAARMGKSDIDLFVAPVYSAVSRMPKGNVSQRDIERILPGLDRLDRLSISLACTVDADKLSIKQEWVDSTGVSAEMPFEMNPVDPALLEHVGKDAAEVIALSLNDEMLGYLRNYAGRAGMMATQVNTLIDCLEGDIVVATSPTGRGQNIECVVKLKPGGEKRLKDLIENQVGPLLGLSAQGAGRYAMPFLGNTLSVNLSGGYLSARLSTTLPDSGNFADTEPGSRFEGKIAGLYVDFSKNTTLAGSYLLPALRDADVRVLATYAATGFDVTVQGHDMMSLLWDSLGWK